MRWALLSAAAGPLYCLATQAIDGDLRGQYGRAGGCGAQAGPDMGRNKNDVDAAS